MEDLHLNNLVEKTAGKYDRFLYSDALYRTKEHISRYKVLYLTAAVLALVAMTSGCATGPVGNVFTDTRDAIRNVGHDIWNSLPKD